MTALEQFQKDRIEALEKEVLRLNGELNEARNEMRRIANKITVSNPVFLKPIQIIDYDPR